MALDATVGGASSNSYVDRETADAYFADRLYASAWDDADDTDKDKALIMATARLEQESYAGYRVTTTQALKFPRSGLYLDGVALSQDAIPSAVIAATCEYALEFIASDATAESTLGDYKSIKVGPIAIELNQPIGSGDIPSDVMRLLRDLRIGTSGAAIIRA